MPMAYKFGVGLPQNAPTKRRIQRRKQENITIREGLKKN
jgi:hypothetical protein